MSYTIRILVVDDEERIVDVVKAYLEKEGYEVLTAMDGERAINIFKEETVHLVVLDLMLPKLSGEEVCSKIRSMSDVPVIRLTAKVKEDDKLEGLAIDADDYLMKPFSAWELVGRAKTLFRRAYRDQGPLAEMLTFNDGHPQVGIRKMRTLKKGEEIELTPYEFKVLAALLTNPGQVFTGERLVERAFGLDYEGFDSTADSYVKNLRQKVEDDPKNPQYISTVDGVGYKFGGSTK